MNIAAIELRIYSPLQILMMAGASYLVLWFSAPIDFVFRGGALAVSTLLVYAILFSIGVMVGFRRWRSGLTRISFDISRVRRFAKLIAAIGGAGLLLRIFERIVLRAGGLVTADFMLNRDLIANVGSGPLAFVGSLFGPMVMFLPFFVLLLRAGGERRKVHGAYMALSLAYPLFDLLFQGSRSTLVIYLGVMFAAAITIQSFRVKPQAFALAGAGIVGLIWLSGYLFWVRSTQIGLDPVASMYTSGYALFAPANDAVLSKLRTSGISGIGGFLYAYVHFCQYLLHGVYEFLYAAENVSLATTYGAQSFYIPVKAVVQAVGDGDTELMISEGVLRSGIYTTLFGPILYDFGRIGGLFASFAFGFGSGALARAARRGEVPFLPLYLLVMGFLPFAFVVNLFTSGTGQFMLLGALVLFALLRARRFRIHVATR